MPKYLVSGLDDRGHRATEAISAASADDAVRRFSARGRTDVVLHSDEVIAHLFQPKSLQHLTPRDYLAIGRSSRLGFMWRLIVRLYRSQWWVFAIGIALIAGRRALDVRWTVLDTVAVAFILSPFAIVVFSELFSPSRKYARAMAYNAWGRWADMLAALPAVRPYLPAPQYAFHEAKALAGLGQVNEALETVRPFADDPKTPAWLYWGQMADVFNAAKLPDRAIECGERAVEHAPDNVTVLIDLAMLLLRHRRDAARARPLLEQARQHAISDLIRPFLMMAEGILAVEEKRPDRARPILEESLKEAERFRHASPLVGAAMDRIHAYLSIVCAALGDSLAAEEHFRLAEPRMRAFEANDLLDRCSKALGHRP